MESRVDTRNVELVRDLMAELEKTQTAGQRSLDASTDRLLNLVKQLGERLDAKNGEIIENFNVLQREMHRLLNERSR